MANQKDKDSHPFLSLSSPALGADMLTPGRLRPKVIEVANGRQPAIIFAPEGLIAGCRLPLAVRGMSALAQRPNVGISLAKRLAPTP